MAVGAAAAILDGDAAEKEQTTEEDPDTIAWEPLATPTPSAENQPGGAEAPGPPPPPPPPPPYGVEDSGPVGVPSPPGGGEQAPSESFVKGATPGSTRLRMMRPRRQRRRRKGETR
jgi:hypothetical protein